MKKKMNKEISNTDDELQKEKTSILEWIKEYRKELIISGICIFSATVLIILGIKNRESLNEYWEQLKKRVSCISKPKDNPLKKFAEWAKTASIEELSAELEKNRQKWIKTGNYGPTEGILKEEMLKRLEEEALKNPFRNTDPNWRWTDKNRWE